MSDAVIQLRDVSKRFGSHQVLEGISFDIPRGAVTNIMGPSGTGKSVLLKNVIGLLKPEQGSIWIDGEDLVQLSDRELYKVRMKMGVLFQDGALFGSMSLYDNIAFPLREHTKRTERDIRDVVMEKADLVGLVAHLQKFPGEISGGMKKRAGLARALVLDPEIVLFDEPDSGLDPVRVAFLDDLILKTKAETNSTFVVITHNIDSTRRIADYMAILFRSHLAAFGSKEELFSAEDPVVRQFLHGQTFGPIGMDELADAEGELERTIASVQTTSEGGSAEAPGEDPYALVGAGQTVDPATWDSATTGEIPAVAQQGPQQPYGYPTAPDTGNGGQWPAPPAYPVAADQQGQVQAPPPQPPPNW